jgi:hypothetical protein
MQAVIHWMFAVILLATISCSAAHAGAPIPERQMPDCPLHQPDDSNSEPQHCEDCAETHFLTESRSSLADSSPAVLPALPTALVVVKSATDADVQSLAAPSESAPPFSRSLRI